MHNLNGSTAQDRACVYMLIDECHDQRMRLIRLSFNEKFDELKADFLASLVIWYEKMSNVMGSNKWITGSEICTADFILYDVLSWNYLFDPMSLNGKDRLMAFKTSFENLDGVREYIEQVPKNLLPPGGKFGNF